MIYALQRRISQRVSEMRTASGAAFDAAFWQSIQRISILHMLMAMVAVIGVVTSASILAAPNGFGGAEGAVPLGVLIGILSIVLFVISLPFVTDIFRIQKRWQASALVTVVSLGIYLTLFLALFFASDTGARHRPGGEWRRLAGDRWPCVDDKRQSKAILNH